MLSRAKKKHIILAQKLALCYHFVLCWTRHVLHGPLGVGIHNKKLSYRRETARQLPTSRGGGLDPPVHSPSSDYTYAYGRIRKPPRTYVKRAVRKAHFKMNRGFKVIQGHPYWSRQESRMVCCRNVQLMPTSFLKRTKIRQRENGKFVDFIDLTHV